MGEKNRLQTVILAGLHFHTDGAASRSLTTEQASLTARRQYPRSKPSVGPIVPTMMVVVPIRRGMKERSAATT